MKTINKIAVVLTLASLMPLTSVNADPISGQGTWETTLHPRDLNSDGIVDAWYDSTLNITWLKDVNLPRSDNLGGVVGISASGAVNWNTAVAYVGKMNSHSYLGQTEWRLPGHTDIGNDGCFGGITTSGGDCSYYPDPSTGELAHMYLVTLGNMTAIDPATGLLACTSFLCDPGNTGPFINYDFSFGGSWWYGQELVTDSSQAWGWIDLFGQAPQPKTSPRPIWPVLDGDIGIYVVEELVTEAPLLPAGTEGVFYIGELSASGGLPPYQWQLTGGVLPAGLELNAHTGEITGIPDQKVTSQVSFTVMDANQKSAQVDTTIVIYSKVGC